MRVQRLDTVIPKQVAVAFVKIDVEGAELEVLKGGEALLARCQPAVFFECGKIHHRDYSTTPEAVHEILTRCGLGVFLMDLTGPLTAQEFSAVYEASYQAGYDRTAWGNYLALPLVHESRG